MANKKLKLALNALTGRFDLVNDVSAMVDGPASATNNGIALFDGTTGKLLKSSTAEIGAANGVATLNASGKLTASQVPAIAVTDTFVVNSQAAMLALSTAETGDVAVRTDLSKSFILAGTDPSVLADWQELLTPTDAVLSVNSQTGIVVLDTDDVAEGATNLYYTDGRAQAAVTGAASTIVTSNLTVARAIVSDGSGKVAVATTTATEIGYVNGVTSAIQTQLDSKQTRVLPSNAQMVYVSYLSGSDVTGNGSYDKPYQTVAFAMTTITDASSNKPYVVALQGARQIETTDIFMKPYTFIVGQMQRATYIRINGGGALKPDASFATNAGWCGLGNLYWGGSSPITWDLQALGGSNNVFVVQNCTLTGTLQFLGRNAGGGDFLEIYTGITLGAVTIDSVNTQLQSLEIAGTLSLQNTQSVSGLGFNANNLTMDAAVTINAVSSATFSNVAWQSASSLTTVGTVALTSYRGLPPTASRTLSGGTTVTNVDDATIVPFNGTVSGLSATNVKTAIDELAAEKAELMTVVAVNSDITLAANKISLVDSTAARTLTLPTAAANIQIQIKDASGQSETNTITINGGGALIDGASSVTIQSNFECLKLVSDGTNYYII